MKESDRQIAGKLGAVPATVEQKSKIENLKAEGPVIEWMLQDVGPDEIAVRLNDMYPKSNVTGVDVQHFVNRHQNIVQALVKSDKKLLQRHLDANFAFRDKLIEMQETAHVALKKAAKQEDYTAIASLQNSILKNIQLFAKLGGLLEPEGNRIELNITEQVATAMAQEHAGKKREMLEKVRAIDVGYEVLSKINNGV